MLTFSRNVFSNRFPDNNILSHDLLEGSYIRCAYASDVQLYEENLSSYIADVNRRHRWIRGDWQIARWIFNRVPSYKGRRVDNPISGLSKWKIFDNLSQKFGSDCSHLSPGSWLNRFAKANKFPDSIWMCCLRTDRTEFRMECIPKSKQFSLTAHIKSILAEFGKSVASVLLTIIFAPYEAAIHLDAIAKALGEFWWARKNRLQWYHHR